MQEHAAAPKFIDDDDSVGVEIFVKPNASPDNLRKLAKCLTSFVAEIRSLGFRRAHVDDEAISALEAGEPPMPAALKIVKTFRGIRHL